jgi:hypothetical protein
MNQEIWKDIEGYDGLYQVSNKSKVRVLDRYCKTRGDGLALRKGRVLKPSLTPKGYLKYTLYKNGKSKNMLEHQLVAKSFIDNPRSLIMINHINEIKTDNRICNLEWTTYKDNNNHGSRTKRASASQINNRGVVVDQYDLNWNYIRTFNSFNEIERVLGFNSSNISKCSLLNKMCYGFYWVR